MSTLKKPGSQNSGGTLTTLFSAAALALGADFIGEFFTFPFFHESNMGNALVQVANSILVPFYNAAGSALGFTPPVLAATGVPTLSFD